jgi:hypothetical protein
MTTEATAMSSKASEALVSLQRRLELVISRALVDFEASTGLMPSEIRVGMVETTTAGDQARHFVVGRVHIRIDQ